MTGNDGENSDDAATGQSASYDAWLDAVAADQGFYLEGPDGTGSLPPRRCCPETGSDDLTREPLPDTGTIDTATVVHVAAPGFADDTPYISAIASFGPVRLTGVVVGVDPDAVGDGSLIGETVTVDIETRETTADRLVVFRRQP
ncbi:MAG: putative nucleic-acid-binding protein containing a Zn-ribbon [uncultured archaeon A07HN63]|nr:MAG: putative nucleic-acid-binding protein containing a Zn-ribbon [uncultured archaeon A07HN63]